MENNTVSYDFEKRRKSLKRRKRVIRIMAIVGSLLMVSSIIGTIICYVFA